MKLAKFTYTDAKGKTTNRKLLVVAEPSNKFSGIDVSELSDDDTQEFAVAYKAAYDSFIAQLEALKDAWDVKHNYRQFIDNRMSNVDINVV